KWPRLMLVRRMVGVAAFAYAAAHLSLYVVDQEFDLRRVAVEIALRFYLTIGFLALMVLATMAATSTDGMARRLGGKRWRQLHRLIYPAALLMVVHFFIQTKANVDEPWVMAGLYGCLMGYRALIAIERRAGPLAEWWPLVLAALATCGTAMGEAIYFWIKFGADPVRVLAADLTFATGIRPAWTVLAICIAVALAGLMRRL